MCRMWTLQSLLVHLYMVYSSTHMNPYRLKLSEPTYHMVVAVGAPKYYFRSDTKADNLIFYFAEIDIRSGNCVALFVYPLTLSYSHFDTFQYIKR